MSDPLKEELDQAIDNIIASTSHNRLVVAGPGTGKTTLFKRLLDGAGARHRRLVLTFINNLKDDLASSLGQFADVYTFHGYCHYLLRRSAALRGQLTETFFYFPALASLIKRDWETVNDGDCPQVVGCMRTLDHDPVVSFYMDRSDYYDSVGFDDSVYRVHRALEGNPQHTPKYELILIDEFQDFNKLESSFIGLLTAESPVVIAGDDDQALYSQLKGASHEFIRALHNGGTFECFALPFCMRCPQAVVESINAIVTKAQERGLLQGRIAKPFRYYPGRKGEDSEKYPTIKKVRTSVQKLNANYFGRDIARAIDAIPASEIAESWQDGFPTVLIIAPQQYLRQISTFLKEAGHAVEEKEQEDNSLKRSDGLLPLKTRPQANLGWRIMIEIDQPPGWEDMMRRSILDRIPLCELIDQDYRSRILAEAAACAEPAEVPTPPPANQTHPRIKLTSFEGSKGMSAQHVFIVGLHETEFPKDAAHITDLEVCKFIVALTRTRKECHLMSTGRFGDKWKNPSLFIDWVPHAFSSTITVNKDYWTSAES